jgi:histidine triad (HIT) family protein
MEGCLFCKIANREIPAQEVYQDDQAVAFRDVKPVAPTHVLVIPREHITSINDVRPEHETLMGHLFRVAAEVARSEGLEARGYRVVMNCGPDAGQSVFHVHLHLVGGRPLGWPPFPQS